MRKNTRRSRSLQTAVHDLQGQSPFSIPSEPHPQLRVGAPSEGSCYSGDNNLARPNLNQQVAEASSGIGTFSRLIGPTDRSEDLGISSAVWNVGFADSLDNKSCNVAFQKVSDIISLEQVNSLSEVYFKDMNAVYGIVSRDMYYDFVRREYEVTRGVDGVPNSQNKNELETFRVIICGVVSLGSLFSRNKKNILPFTDRVALETNLINRAYEQLDNSQVMEKLQSNTSGLYIAVGWVLRMLYLRATSSPNNAWLATCRAMSIAEIVNLHDEQKWGRIDLDPNHLRHVFWSLENLNTFWSLDMGKSKANLSYVRVAYPNAESDTDFFPSVMDIYDITKKALAAGSCEPEVVYEAFSKLLSYKPVHPEVWVHWGYTLIMLYRRMSLFSMNNHTINALVEACCHSLGYCRELALSGHPWWKIVTFPFQFLCMMLKIDDCTYTPRLSDILGTMLVVAQKFPDAGTESMIRVSRTLLSLFKQRKEQNLVRLEEKVSDFENALEPKQIPAHVPVNSPTVTSLLEEEVYPWALDDLVKFQWSESTFNMYPAFAA